MTKKQHIEQIERLDDIHSELRNMNENLDDLLEARRSEKTEFSFLLSLVGVGISVSSVLVKSISGDPQISIIGGGISLVLLVMIASFMKRMSRERPIPKEIIMMLLILLVTSLYSIGLGLGMV
jgi:hypothetical protein